MAATDTSAPAEATPTGATPIAPTAPAEAEKPVAIADLPLKFDDGSGITSKAKAEALFAGFEDLASTWYGGYKATRTATADVCKLTYDLRAICTRPDGKPDWAGQYKAYAELFETRVTYVLTHTLKMNKDERTAFRAAVRRYDSDNEYKKLYIARVLVAADKTLGVKPDEIVAGFKPAPALAKALVHEAEGQTVTDSNGKVKFAPGYDNPQTFAQAEQPIGVKKSQRTPKADPVTPTLSGQWEALQAAMVKRTDDGKKPAVSFREQAEQLHKTVSAITVGIVGKPGEKSPGGISDKTATVALLTATRDLLTGLLTVWDGNVSAEQKAELLAKLAS